MPRTRKTVSFEVVDSEGTFLTKHMGELNPSRDVCGDIKVKPLLDSLMRHMTSGRDDKHLISYHNAQYNCFVFIGHYHSLKFETLSDDQVGDTIQFKFRKALT